MRQSRAAVYLRLMEMKAMKLKNRSTSFNAQHGIMLLESLIAILVFSLGILAMVGMQAVSIAHTSQAKYRADASFIANKLIAQMWVDADANMPLYATGGASFTNWLNNEVKANLTGGRSNATVTVTPFVASAVVGVAAAPVNGFVIDVSIQWRAPNEADSAPAHVFVTRTQIIRNATLNPAVPV